MSLIILQKLWRRFCSRLFIFSAIGLILTVLGAVMLFFNVKLNQLIEGLSITTLTSSVVFYFWQERINKCSGMTDQTYFDKVYLSFNIQWGKNEPLRIKSFSNRIEFGDFKIFEELEDSSELQDSQELEILPQNRIHGYISVARSLR